MRYFTLLIGLPPLVLGIAGAVFTANKLHKMQQIRGWEPGAVIRLERVQGMWIGEGETYWISIQKKDIRSPGNHRLNLPKVIWQKYSIGDPIEIVSVPGDPFPYHRLDIFADDGNFAFDKLLFVFECGLAGGAVPMTVLTYWLLHRQPRKPYSNAKFGS